MNALLLHANNLNPTLLERFAGDNIALDYSHSVQRSNFMLDRFLHEELSKAFENKKYQVIFITYTLSQQNYLELTGLRVAIHIRITEIFNHTCAPIVFVGPETPEQIAKLSDLGNILFASGTYSTTSQDPESFKKQFEWIINNKPEITQNELTRCIEHLKLSPPANYHSHHSIDNELSLLRWSEYLRCDDRIPEVKENLQTGLYFKYYRLLNLINPPEKGSTYLINGKGKVLLIDDEAEKGWMDFYKCFFKNNINNKSIEIEALKADFKSLNQQDIIEVARKKVEQFDSDIVMLDLRLCDLDFNTNPQLESKELTGYKILKEIKKINKGIQVIITTASNKIWNYQSTRDLGANGYIIKGGDSDVAEDIRNLKQTIELCIKRLSYLKPAHKLIDLLSNSLNKAMIEGRLDKNFGKELIKLLDLSFKMFDNAHTMEDFAYAYLALYKSLELIIDKYTFIDTGIWQIVGSYSLNQYVWEKQQNAYNSNTLPSFRNNIPTTFEKLAGLCFQLWNYTDTAVQQLYYSIKRRNEFIHPSNNPLTTNQKKEFEMIYKPDGYTVLLKQISDIVKNIIT